MWPKMLIELLPHLSRLVPLWEKFLNSKAASDKANEAALAALAESVRADLGQVTSAHSALYRQLQDQAAQIALLSEEIKLARDAAERAETAARHPDPEVAALAASVRRVGTSLFVAIALLVVVILLQVVFHHA